MKLTVIAPFHDKDSFSTVYNVGQVVEFETERAQSVIGRGLATPFEEADNTKEESVVEEKEKEVQQSVEESTEDEAKPKRGRGRNKKD